MLAVSLSLTYSGKGSLCKSKQALESWNCLPNYTPAYPTAGMATLAVITLLPVLA